MISHLHGASERDLELKRVGLGDRSKSREAFEDAKLNWELQKGPGSSVFSPSSCEVRFSGMVFVRVDSQKVPIVTIKENTRCT